MRNIARDMCDHPHPNCRCTLDPSDRSDASDVWKLHTTPAGVAGGQGRTAEEVERDAMAGAGLVGVLFAMFAAGVAAVVIWEFCRYLLSN